MTVPLHHVLCYSLLVGEFKRTLVVLLPGKSFCHVIRFVVRLPIIYLSTLHVSLAHNVSILSEIPLAFLRGISP